VCLAFGQQERKIIYKVEPQYPPILKEKQIGGLVRIVATVSPSGTVNRTEPMGGNPVLVIAAQTAVRQWKFEPAGNETREYVVLRFDPAAHK
jgi:TonB family protein